MIKTKRLATFLIFVVIIIINTKCFAKYKIENNIDIADIKIDGQKPKIEMVGIYNSNTKYPEYASKKHNITVKIRVTENNIIKNNFDKNHIKIYVGNNEITPKVIDIQNVLSLNDKIIYDINLEKIEGNGLLKVEVLEDAIIDMGNQSNDRVLFNTNINIDNIAPIATFTQKSIESGKISAEITTNEKIQDINAWNLDENKEKLSKNFECNVTYPIKIYDYAFNYTEPMVNITKATNIQIQYSSCCTGCFFEYGRGNGEMVGKESIKVDPLNKIEGMTLSYKGNIEKDFIQAQAYMHTYWGENTSGLCFAYETAYKTGYNPGKDSYFTLKNGDTANVNGNLAFVIGGDGVNNKGYDGLQSSKELEIPEDIAKQKPFGISALRLKLKDTSYYSIVYQIRTKETGWLEAASDDVETTYSHDKAINSYRISLIPKTEKQYLIDYWNKDIGK